MYVSHLERIPSKTGQPIQGIHLMNISRHDSSILVSVILFIVLGAISIITTGLNPV